MGTVVLGWDPDKGNRWNPSYDDYVRRCRADHGLVERWPVGTWSLAPAGTHVHLMLTGRQRGLVGRGSVRSAPFLSADPTRPGQMVTTSWSSGPPSCRSIGASAVEALEAAVPEMAWRSSHASATALSPQGAQQLDLPWAADATSPAQRLTRTALRLLRR